MSKATNMLSILWLLRSGGRMTAQQLADELEIHIRTVYRCIDSLCASGVPIIADPGRSGGYRILETFSESPLLFDLDEQKALVHASTFAQEAGYPFQEALVRAIDKLKRYTNEKQLTRIERHLEGLSVIQTPAGEKEQERLRVLEEAAATGITVEMTYDKGKGAGPEARPFDPYGIVHWKGSWYTVGYCGLRREMRSFRTDRIIDLQMTDRRFGRPAAFSAKEFLMNQLLPDALASETLVLVRIRGHEHALEELGRHWLFGHAQTERGEGEAVYRLGLSSLLTYVPYFLLPYGRAISVVEPYELIEKLAEVSSGLADHYQAMKDQSKSRKG
ncbi:helix-turn-helix transcriptional regulator [Cohnella zeiphila]|uniref:YafY family transcriptional regulator n=1 Tax=Cohnella zeiphila TaxID=2761120 RepID=A0A7X0SJ88_9BACL|nr:YafY family protein [Cohnella zeiphila]MBB6730984.1 YafY family transcriptional regulator [Cohnella zeiphila]